MTRHLGVPCGVSYILQKKPAASNYPPWALWGEAMPRPRQQKTAGLTCSHHATLYHECYEVPIQLPHIFTNFHSLDSGRSPRALGQETDPIGSLETHTQHTSWPKLWPRPWPSRMPASSGFWPWASRQDQRGGKIQQRCIDLRHQQEPSLLTSGSSPRGQARRTTVWRRGGS